MDWRNTSLLIVDDERHMRWLLAALFRHRGATVYLAADGQAALDAFEEQGPDLVILDLLLPGMTGYEVLQAMRRESQVPVVILTAITSNEVIRQHLNAGANDYVNKPLDPELLLARCAAALNGAARAVGQRPERQSPVAEGVSYGSVIDALGIVGAG